MRKLKIENRAFLSQHLVAQVCLVSLSLPTLPLLGLLLALQAVAFGVGQAAGDVGRGSGGLVAVGAGLTDGAGAATAG